MALQNKVGIEKLVYKATAGDVTLAGEDMADDIDTVFEKITGSTAKGTLKRNGNIMVDFAFAYFDVSVLAAIEADEGTLNDLEVWQLGSTAADETIADVELIAEDRLVGDPESEEPGGINIRVHRVYNG